MDSRLREHHSLSSTQMRLPCGSVRAWPGECVVRWDGRSTARVAMASGEATSLGGTVAQQAWHTARRQKMSPEAGASRCSEDIVRRIHCSPRGLPGPIRGCRHPSGDTGCGPLGRLLSHIGVCCLHRSGRWPVSGIAPVSSSMKMWSLRRPCWGSSWSYVSKFLSSQSAMPSRLQQ